MSTKSIKNTHVVRPRTSSYVPAVAAEIERLINTGQLVGGDRVNESALASRLGVSRGPIREACRALERIGLVRSEVNRGFFIQEIGIKEALDLYEVRAGLFRTAGRILVDTINSKQVGELRSFVAQMDAAADADDYPGFYSLNGTFHRSIVEFTGNEKLIEMWPTLEAQVNLFRRRCLVVQGVMHGANVEHGAIVEALERGDATAAALQAERHVLSGKERLLRTIGGTPLGTRQGGDLSTVDSLRIVKSDEEHE